MDEQQWLAERFRDHAPRLRAVAYRMLGSPSEADDAVQEAWLRMSRADAGEVEDIGAWMTTVVARVSLNLLRSRARRREQALGPHVPDPIVEPADGSQPEHEALLADSVALALLVVLETLTPAERLAYVLHDMFDLPFARIAAILDRTPETTRQLASRARRRIRALGPPDGPPPADARAVVDAYLAASRDGDFAGLVAVLDPDVALTVDGGRAAAGLTAEVRGADAVARRALAHSRRGLLPRPALVNGAPGVVFCRDGVPVSVLAVTVAAGRIVRLDILADPDRLAGLT